MHEGPVPRSGPSPHAPAPVRPTCQSLKLAPTRKKCSLNVLEDGGALTSDFISAATATPPKRLTPPATATPTRDVKADARRRPPTITRPLLVRMRFVSRHAFLPCIEKVPIQVGPRFVKTTHSYESFHGTSRIHESFSCKLVVTYRILQMTRPHRGGSRDQIAPRTCVERVTISLPIGRNVPRHHDNNGNR
jgi:hypothetical protein